MKILRSIIAAALLFTSSAFAANQAPIVTPTAGPMSAATFTTNYLNPALLAIGTCNWGPTAPANGPGAAPTSYQCWMDTSGSPTNIALKYYDGAAWATLASLNASTHAWSVTIGSTINAQTGATYTFADTDRGKLVDLCNASPISATLPQPAIGGTFLSGWYVVARNNCAGSVTITSTSSTIDGLTTSTLRTGQSYTIRSDGSNYLTSLASVPSWGILSGTAFKGPATVSAGNNISLSQSGGNVAIAVGTDPVFTTVGATQFNLNGSSFAYSSTSYSFLYAPGVGNPRLLFGGSGDPANYYDNNTHYFRTSAAAATLAVLNTSGFSLSNATGGGLGDGTINTKGVYVNGTQIPTTAPAATRRGNPTAATAAIVDYTVQGLTARGTPNPTADKIEIFDASAGTMKYVTPAQIAASTTSGVASINGQTGTLTTDSTLTNSGSAFGLAPFTQSWTGAVSKSVLSRFQQEVYATEFGVICDGSTNTTTQLQNALSYAASVFRPLRITRASGTDGRCIVGGSSGNAITMTEPFVLNCDPGIAITPSSAMGSTSSSGAVFYLYGSPNGVTYPTGIDCFIGDSGAATRYGSYAIVYNTLASGALFYRGWVRGFVQAGKAGYPAIVHVNDPSLNVTGALANFTFGSENPRSNIQGGISLNSSGDSITIQGQVSHNYAPGADDFGIYVNLIPGAANLKIDNINFSQAGGVVIDCAYMPVIEGGEYELQSTLGASGLVHFRGNNCTITSARVSKAVFQSDAGYGTPVLIYNSANTTNTTLDQNFFSTPTAYSPVANLGTNLICGPNTFVIGGAAKVSGTASAVNYGGGC